MEKTFKTVASLPGSGCPSKFISDHLKLRDSKKNPRATSCVLQATVSTLNVYVIDQVWILGNGD